MCQKNCSHKVNVAATPMTYSLTKSDQALILFSIALIIAGTAAVLFA